MSASYRPRRVERTVRDALADTRVVTVNGARQVGKRTLVHALLADLPGARERKLDHAAEREAARLDPTGFVRHSGLLAIDEIQREPELILAIKAAVDDDPSPGRFLLTGSARLLGLRGLPDALVGRMETVELWPFSQGELHGGLDRFVDVIFNDDWRAALDLPGIGSTSRDDYLERALCGGFPEAVRRSEPRRAKFFTEYLDDLSDRDVTQLAEIARGAELRRLIRLLAGALAQPLNVSRFASELGISARTVERYIAVFEEIFLIKRLDGWASSETGRAQRLRKLIFVDSGSRRTFLASRSSGFADPTLR